MMIDPSPWQIWEAHKGDVVALSWSRNDFLLSASLDKSVRLWHTTQAECLHCFHHAETVTSVDFHPLLEHFFLSGCFDKKIRVWNIRDGRVQEWQQAPDLVTAAKFSLDGQMIVAGLYMGQVPVFGRLGGLWEWRAGFGAAGMGSGVCLSASRCLVCASFFFVSWKTGKTVSGDDACAGIG